MTTSARRQVQIVNKLGLHARAAAKLVKTAGGFGSNIIIRRDGKEADAKSIMSVMMLAASCGSEVELEATGEDATVAIAALESLIEQRFGEPE